MDTTKIKNSLDKKDIATTLSEPDVWLDSGNYALNEILSGSFSRGVPNRRSTLVWGGSNTGKSLLLGHWALRAQQAGYTVIYIDTEDAINAEFLTRIGVEIDDEQWFLPIRISTIEDAAQVISEIFSGSTADDRVCIMLDSLSMLETEQEMKKFVGGELQEDQGRLAKKFKSLIKNVNAKIGDKDMFFVYTMHAYENQDLQNGKGKFRISGGEGQLYIPSISLLLDKLKLKEGQEVVGFKMKAEIYKSRFSRLGGKAQLEIPYETGIDPYDGLLETFESRGVVTKNGAWFNYVDENGKTHKFQRKKSKEHLDYLLEKESKSPTVVKESSENTEAEDDDS